MSELNFTKLADAPVLEEVPDGAKVYAEVDGKVYRVAGDNLGGGLAIQRFFWVEPNQYNQAYVYASEEYTDVTYAEFVDALKNGLVQFYANVDGQVYYTWFTFRYVCDDSNRRVWFYTQGDSGEYYCLRFTDSAEEQVPEEEPE